MTTTTMSLQEILTRLMFQWRIRPTELARQLNISQPTLSRIVTGKSTRPHPSSLTSLASFFEVSIAQLKGLEPIPWLESASVVMKGWAKIPLRSWTEINLQQDSSATPARYLFTDAVISQDAYMLVMQDASMEPQFPQGTLLVIDPQKTAKDHSFVVAHLQHATMPVFRQLVLNGADRYLKPLSPDNQQFKITCLEKEDKILGVLVQARCDFEA